LKQNKTENDKVYKDNEAIEELDGENIMQTVQTSSALFFLTGKEIISTE